MSRLLLQFLLLGAAVIATLAHEVPPCDKFEYEPDRLLGGAHQVRRRPPLVRFGQDFVCRDRIDPLRSRLSPPALLAYFFALSPFVDFAL